MWYKNYEEATEAAQAKADRTGCHVRLKAAKVYGQPGFSVRIVPQSSQQFGCDLEGELFTPRENQPRG